MRFRSTPSRRVWPATLAPPPSLRSSPTSSAISAVVVDAQTHSPVDFWQALTRYVGYFVSTLPLLAGLAWVAVDARKQGWHDKMARTVVVYRR